MACATPPAGESEGKEAQQKEGFARVVSEDKAEGGFCMVLSRIFMHIIYV